MTFDWTPHERRFTVLHALGLAGVMGLVVARFVPVAPLPVPRLSAGEARAGRAAVVAAVLANYAFVIVQTRLGWR